ncbi:hypothetical protein [Actinokineospora sp. NPDC004072]
MITEPVEEEVSLHHAERPTRQSARPAPAVGAGWPLPAARLLAMVRIAMGLVFAWAFLDKSFGLGYATPSANAWINGGSPTKGFLGGIDRGPLGDMSAPGPGRRGRTGCSWPGCSASGSPCCWAWVCAWPPWRARCRWR